jgi:dCMP deaminase
MWDRTDRPCIYTWSALFKRTKLEWSREMRPDWDSYFMELALVVAKRSTCARAFVGCVLVKDRKILATGYNGSPSGLPHCDDSGHLMVEGHCVRTIHAEQNAIIQASTDLTGATAYVTAFPCLICTKLLIQAGIRRVVYLDNYRVSEQAVEMFNRTGVEITKCFM